MIRPDDIQCSLGQIETVLEGPGSYSYIDCLLKGHVNNCNGCPNNKREKIMRADPNNYPDWLRRHQNERT